MILFGWDRVDEGEMGGMPPGGAPGAEGGFGPPPGGAIPSGDVLGPCHHEDGGGFLHGKCFHVPFPVMPVLRRYGWTTSAKKAKKNAKTYKNPYAKGMKTIVAEAEPERVEYSGEALKALERITGGAGAAYGGVLYYNPDLKAAWRFAEDGELKIYKPVMPDGASYWTVYATRLTPEGNIEFEYKAGRYPTEQAAAEAVWKAAEQHKAKLQESLGGGGESLVEGLSPEQVDAAFAQPSNDSERADPANMLKFAGPGCSVTYYGLYSDASRQCLALAAVERSRAYPGDVYVAEIQSLRKGAGERLLAALRRLVGPFWLMCNAEGGESLLSYYRRPAFGFEEYEVGNSVYGCPVSFFYTPECDERRLLGYVDAFFDNGSSLDSAEEG